MPHSPDPHWSTSFDASSEDDNVTESLRRFLQAFWFPVFAFAHRQTNSATAAKECLAPFATAFIIDAASPAANVEETTLRAILLQALTTHDWQTDHVISDANADGLLLSEQDWSQGRAWFDKLQLEDESAESAFQQAWAWTLQNRELSRLRKEFSCDGRAEVFAVVDDYLLADEETPWAELAESLHMSATARKTTASRMQERLQTLLKREVAQTTASPADAADEFALLFAGETGERGS